MMSSSKTYKLEYQEVDNDHCFIRKASFPYFLEFAMFLFCVPYAIFTTVSVLYLYTRMADSSPLGNLSVSGVLLLTEQGSTCAQLNTSTSDFQSKTLTDLELEVKSKASQWEIYIMVCLFLPGVITVPLLGSFSSKYGYKQGLMIPAVGGILLGLGFIVVETFNLSVAYLLIPAFLAGCHGYIAGMASVLYAYLADITGDKYRLCRFVVLSSIYCLVNALGTMVSGYMKSVLNYNNIFCIITSSFILYILFVNFFVPQHIPEPPPILKEQKSIITSLFDTIMVFKVYTRRRNIPYQRCRLNLLLLVVLLEGLMTMNNIILETIFLIGVPYCLTSVEVSFFNGIVAFVGAIGTVFVAQILKRCLSDVLVLLVAMSMTFLAFLIEGSTSNIMVLYVTFPPLYMLAISMMAQLRAIMSQIVEPHEQGALQASVSICGSMAHAISIVLLISIYNATITIFNGLVFLFCSGIGATAVILIVFVIVLEKKEPKEIPLLQT